MHTVEREVFVLHTPEQMFNLVANFTHYQRFLPWCERAEILSQNHNQTVARLHIHYLMVRQHFTTCNYNQPHQSITMQLVDGPFQHLDGLWQFTPLGDRGCKIQFRLSYEFSSRLLEKLIGPVFDHISSTLVDAFIKEADTLYSI